MSNSGFENSDEIILEDFKLIPLKGLGGATCEVFKARVYGKWLFIKKLKEELKNNPRYAASFRKEQELGFQLDHPNLPRFVLGENILPNETTVIMEYIQGLPLDKFIEAHPDYFSKEENIVKFISEICSVLDYLHSHQIVHLDIKPSNILITDVGFNTKLIDLGFCSSDVFKDTEGISQDFAAPERSSAVGTRSEATDYYGLGILLEFIEERTPAFPRKRFTKLIEGLLASDPHNRIKDSKAVESLLAANNWKAIRYFGPVLLVGLLIALSIFFYSNHKNGGAEAPHIGSEVSNKEVPPALSDNNRQEETEINTENYQLDEKPVKNIEETAPVIPAITGSSSADMSSPAADNNDLKQKLRVEIHKNIKEIYGPLSQEIRKSLESGNFTREEYNRLNDAVNRAIHESMRIKRYKDRFPQLAEDDIADILSEEMETVEKPIWASDWSLYKEEYSKRGAVGNDR